jgi:hypothetical protein
MSNENQRPQLQIKQPTTKGKENNSIKIPTLTKNRRNSITIQHPQLGRPSYQNDPSTKTENMCEEAANYCMAIPGKTGA